MSANSAPWGDWVSLVQYASRYSVSLSTLRRYIKSGKIKYKSEEGRYLVWDDHAHEKSTALKPSFSTTSVLVSEKQVAELELQLKRAQQEIAELKMLVALYEQQKEL